MGLNCGAKQNAMGKESLYTVQVTGSGFAVAGITFKSNIVILVVSIRPVIDNTYTFRGLKRNQKYLYGTYIYILYIMS